LQMFNMLAWMQNINFCFDRCQSPSDSQLLRLLMHFLYTISCSVVSKINFYNSNCNGGFRCVGIVLANSSWIFSVISVTCSKGTWILIF
jgi:hypothetical protein